MRSYVQILTTPTADTPGTTLMLHFDNRRYIIGSLGEGTQRAGVQMGARFLKASQIFLTGRSEWSNTGGLIGMILTLADSVATSQGASKEEAAKKAYAKARRLGVQYDEKKMQELQDEAFKDLNDTTLSMFGPPNLTHTLATARRFVFRKGMPIDVHEILNEKYKASQDEDEWAPYYADENVKVWAMSISPKPSSRPISPRKRSINEVYGQETTSDGTLKDAYPRRNDHAAKHVVDEMFSSSWTMDTLYETPLSQVNLPATIFIRNPTTNKVEKYKGPLPGGEIPLPDPNLKVLVRRPWPGALVKSLPSTKPAKQSISYIIRNHQQRGKFKPDAAAALKVEKGHKFSKLASGSSVLNADGEEITPDMVLGPTKEGGGFAVVDLPDPTYIEPLINRPEWSEEKVMVGVGAIIWICGKDVASDSRLHDFMRRFSNLSHLVSSPDYCPNELAFDSTAASTTRLHKIDPARYRVPVHDVQGQGKEQIYGGSNSFEDLRQQHPLPDNNVHVARRGHIFQLEPSLELSDSHVVPPTVIADVEEQLPQGVLNKAGQVQRLVKTCSSEDMDWVRSLPEPEAEVITLGTGSALPSKYRNVSATLIRVPGWGSMLMDCGENTLGQLKRVFTPGELRQVLRELKLIFISHMHADHHLGTVGVVKAWYEEVHKSQPGPTIAVDADKQAVLSGPESRLSIVSEPAMLHWLTEYAEVEDFGFSRLTPVYISPAFPDNKMRSQLGWFVPENEASPSALAKNSIPASALDLADIKCVLVHHCHGARAVSITLPFGFKVSYSGDCRPSKAFTEIGKGSTVCIHEATFDDELRGDAVAKNHSTTSEALGVAQAMKAKACILTHFSQRYQKLPVFQRDHGEASGEEVEVEGPAEADDVKDAGFEVSGSLEDNMAPTLPDQADGSAAPEGQKYDIPSKNGNSDSAGSPISPGAPAEVRFRLNSDMKVCVAFDYMRVKVKDIWQMEKFTPVLLKLFAEEAKTEKTSEESKKGNSKKAQKKLEKKRSLADVKNGGKKAEKGANGARSS